MFSWKPSSYWGLIILSHSHILNSCFSQPCRTASINGSVPCPGSGSVRSEKHDLVRNQVPRFVRYQAEIEMFDPMDRLRMLHDLCGLHRPFPVAVSISSGGHGQWDDRRSGISSLVDCCRNVRRNVGTKTDTTDSGINKK